MYSDRLGSTRATWVATYGGGSTTRNYYPFGEEITSTANNGYKFASTYRDSATGLDYAVNRYYASGTGRFLSTDPYRASGGPADPQGLNRYTYAQNDPVNFRDPTGLLRCGDDEQACEPQEADPDALGGLTTCIWVPISQGLLGSGVWVCSGNSNNQLGTPRSAPQPQHQYWLLKTRDCYSFRNGPNITREVTYSLQDGGSPATGQPNEFVWEYVTDNSTGLAADDDQPNTNKRHSGIYDDQQSLGGLTKSTTERWLTQQFFLGTQTKYDFNAPLSVEGWGSRLLIHQTSKYVTINGDRGGTTDKDGQWHPNMCPP